MDDENLIALKIGNHGEWVNVDLLEILHRDYPEIIGRFKVQGVTAYKSSPEELKALRACNISSLITLTDGSVYAPTGGGVASDGTNSRHALETIICRRHLHRWQNEIINKSETLREEFVKRGIEVPEKVNARFVISDGKPQVWIVELDRYYDLLIS